eukprot:8830165-Pyramimonas_sp.AAC.1
MHAEGRRALSAQGQRERRRAGKPRERSRHPPGSGGAEKEMREATTKRGGGGDDVDSLSPNPYPQHRSLPAGRSA